MGSPAQALGIAEAAKEIERINKSLSDLEALYNQELQKQLAPIRDYYGPRIAKASAIKPRDTMFETEEDYKARAAKQKQEAETLQRELSEKEQEIYGRDKPGTGCQKKALVGQREALCKQEFELGSGEIDFKLKTYDPKDEFFDVDFTGKGAYAKTLTFQSKIGIPKAKAKLYWENQSLLIPVVMVRLDEKGQVTPSQILLRGPEGEKYLPPG